MKICLFFNTPSIYREAIYKMIDKEYDCDWFFGELSDDVKCLDIKCLKHSTILGIGNKGRRVYWTKGLISLLFKKKYKTYFMYGPTWDLSFWPFLIIKALFFRKKKLNIWVHGWYGKETWLEGILKKFMFHVVDGIFCYGDYAKKMLLEMGYSKDKVFAIHNSLNYDEQLTLRKKQHDTEVYKSHFHNENPTIIFLGRLTSIKRLDMILDAVSILKQNGQLFNIVYVGNGPMRDMLEHKAKVLCLSDQVWFYGACYDEEKNAELVYNADLCVAPGNVGLTAVHTMMFGCPVITHDNFPYQMPEFEAVKPSKTGLFFDFGNVESLANQIANWFSQDNYKREAIRENCYMEVDTNWNPYYQIDIVKHNLKIAD